MTHALAARERNTRNAAERKLYKYRGIITAVFCSLLLFLPPVEWQQGTIAGYIGIPLFTAAFFLRIWARMHIGEHTRGSKLACFGIVKTGPYKYIKHPLYLSNFMAGAAFAFFHAGFSFSVLGFCIIYGFFLAVLAINENKFLQSINSHVELPITPQYIHNILWNDRYTWLWQIAIIVIIFLKKL